MECFAGFTSPCADLSTGAANQYLALMLNYLSIAQCSLSAPEVWPEDYGNIAIDRGFEEYDFIIVGAGSAGSVVASRLSENPDWNILLLEAGGDPPIESLIPALTLSMQTTEYDWKYYTEPHDKYSNYWPRGKMLGGSSSMNGMLYVRGNEGDYDNWEKLGNPTWGWDNVLEYFKKSESNQNPEIANDYGGHYHSQKGLLSVELFKDNQTINFDIIQAAQELGFKFVEDINGKEHIGFTFSQGTVRSGVRESTAKAFLVPAKDRPNLHVVKNAHVLDLEVDSDGVVSGVRMNLRGQKELKPYAKKEVILSAGSINSPQILMLSGIGPESHLQEMGIPLIRNLQVGKNLQDHPAVLFLVKYNDDDSGAQSQSDFAQTFFSYLTEHTGAFTAVGTMQTLGYVNVHEDPFSKYPDFQFYQTYFQKGLVDSIVMTFRSMGLAQSVIDFAAAEIQKSSIFVVLLSNFIPESKGEILLRSAEPTEKPRIIPNYLSDYSDVKAFIKAIRLYLKFLSTKTYQSHQAELAPFPIPECDNLEFSSDDYWDCYCRYSVSTSYHPSGTNKMGPDDDPEAVVDYKLRVKGTTGLRVIDASIMPRIPRGNTNAPAIMIGEKGADFIKEDWSYSDN